MTGRKVTMSPYIDEIETVVKAMEQARIALVNLHNKYQKNWMPFAIANALELELASLLSTVKVMSDDASSVRVSYAMNVLERAGYEVKVPRQ